jgi:hypothetical protein
MSLGTLTIGKCNIVNQPWNGSIDLNRILKLFSNKFHSIRYDASSQKAGSALNDRSAHLMSVK